VVARYFPDYPALYRRRGWSMFRSIDRVYSAARAEAGLGFRCRTGFAEVLAALAGASGVNPPWAGPPAPCP
jgi:UDP-glucose 4-epimerase